MRQQSTTILFALVLTFLLNLVWENAQAPLYTGYVSLAENWPWCTRAALGDVLLMGIIYVIMAGLYDRHWIRDFSRRHLIGLFLTGGLIGLLVEWWGLQTLRWQYADMPLLPLLGVGLTPLLQMLVLPPIITWFVKRRIHKHAL